MVNRHQRSQITSSPSRIQLFFKLERLTSRHEQMKTAYHELKTQINAGLLEAEEVFASLAVPLIKLVGLKTKEMAEEGRLTTIIIDNDFSQGCRRNGLEPQLLDDTTRRERENQIEILEGESYVTKATIAGKELMEKQQTNLLHLVQLLRQVEIQVNCHQDEIFETLDNHRASLHNLFQKAIHYISDVHSQNRDNFLTTLNLLQVMFNNVDAILGSVEGGVNNLMQELAEKMCNPMVEYVKSLKDDMKNGTCVRLLAMVEEMERMISNGRLELEDARKKVRVAEEGKIEAVCKLKTIEERVMRMRGHFSLPEAGFTEPSTPHKFLGMEGKQAKDEKLLWNLLKKKRKHKALASPMGPEGLLCFDGNNRHPKLVDMRLSLDHRQITRGCRKGLGPRTSPLNSCIPLGSSPSVAIQQAVSHKRITP
ncbi:hypothetical protein JCGZ_26361 [Jatropha curcas]|nr:hypothetical protein JCGZ_26361 [Jatropha curcas]